MAPSACLASLLVDHVSPSLLLEIAGEGLESLDAEISQCELDIKEGGNDDGEISSNGHDDGKGMNEELEGWAPQQTERKGREGSRSKTENQDELARLRRGRDVMVQDVSPPLTTSNLCPNPQNPTLANAKTQFRWLQALLARTPSPSHPSSSQNPPSASYSTSTPTRDRSSLSPNSTPISLDPPTFSFRSIIEPGFYNSHSISTITTTHQHARRTSRDGAWSRRSSFRGRERVRRPRSGEDQMTTAAMVIGSLDAWGGRAIDGKVVAAEQEEKRIIGVET